MGRRPVVRGHHPLGDLDRDLLVGNVVVGNVLVGNVVVRDVLVGDIVVRDVLVQRRLVLVQVVAVSSSVGHRTGRAVPGR